MPFRKEPEDPLLEEEVGNSLGVDSERRVVGAGVGGGASGLGSFLGVTVAGLLVVLGVGGESSTLGGVYLRVVLGEGVLLCGGGAVGVLLLRLVFDCDGAGAVGCCCGCCCGG